MTRESTSATVICAVCREQLDYRLRVSQIIRGSIAAILFVVFVLLAMPTGRSSREGGGSGSAHSDWVAQRDRARIREASPIAVVSIVAAIAAVHAGARRRRLGKLGGRSVDRSQREADPSHVCERHTGARRES